MRTLICLILTAAGVALAFVLVRWDEERDRPEGSGLSHGYRMLVAFAGDRNYEAALHEARLICDHFPDSLFHDYARGLVEQLPRRMDDFKTLRLPTPAEWADLKTRLTREQQIDFLCARMRLLTISPGRWYFLTETQYAEPPGMDQDASESLHRGVTKVINPVQQLAGWNGGMPLSVSEIPLLTPHLRDDWYLLRVRYFCVFNDERHLGSTRPVYAGIINELARKDLCKDWEWKHLTSAEIDKEIERINGWATAHADSTIADIEWEALQEKVANGAPWNVEYNRDREVKERVETLLELNHTQVYDVMRQYLLRDSTPHWCKSNILSLYSRHDWKRAKDLALALLQSPDMSVRLQAALIVSRNGDTAKARGVIANSLANLPMDDWSIEVWEILLNDRAEVSRPHLVRLFSTGEQVPPELLSRCTTIGMKEPYQYYVALLDNNGEHVNRVDDQGNLQATYYYSPNVAQAFAQEIVEKFAPHDPVIKEIVAKHPKTADQVLHLKHWLKSRIAAKKD